MKELLAAFQRDFYVRGDHKYSGIEIFEWLKSHDREEGPAPARWRVGHSVPLNVYEGDRPVCQCHSAEDAARIVAAMNAAEACPCDALRAEVERLEGALARKLAAALVLAEKWVPPSGPTIEQVRSALDEVRKAGLI